MKIGEENVEPSEASDETVDIPGPDAATPVENGDAVEAVRKETHNESSDFESLIEHYLEASKGWMDSSVKFSYRVTHSQVVSNLPLTPKQMLRFSICSSY